MDQEQIRELYRKLRDIPDEGQERYDIAKEVTNQIVTSRVVLPEKAKAKVETAKGLFAIPYREDIAKGENLKTTIEELKEVLRTIYSMTVHRTTEDEMADESELYETPGFSNLPYFGRSGGMKRKSQTARFCRCIKSVRKTLKARKGSTKEQGAIAVCVKSVLHTKGKTIKKFKCGKKMRVVTQKRK
jgi:hypothetical protein